MITAEIALAGLRILASDSFVNHGFPLTRSTSLFVTCESEEEIDWLVRLLGQGEAELPPVDDYRFSRKFAWVNDRFGVSWQLNLE